MLWGARTSSASIEWPTSSEARPNSSSVSRLRAPPELHISAPAHEKYRGWWRFGGEMQRSWRPRRNSKVSKPASQSIPVNPPFHPSFYEWRGPPGSQINMNEPAWTLSHGALHELAC